MTSQGLWIRAGAVAVAACAVELAALAGLWIVTGHFPTPSGLQRLRSDAAALGEDDGTVAAPVESRGVQPLPSLRHDLLNDVAHSRRVVHPYLGFVYDPDLNGANSRAGFPAISPTGFLVTPESPVPSALPPVRVGILGGSFAMLLALDGAEALRAEIARGARWRGRKVEIVSMALGGYKEPQQLLALNYALVRGERFDIIINVDGFNEVALPYAENRPRGVASDYPRGWDALASGLASPNAQRLMGLGEYVSARRRSRARAFSRFPWRYSFTSNLVWWALDRRDAALAAQTSERLSRLRGGATGFAALGPRESAADEPEYFRRLALEWQRASLLMHRTCVANGVEYYHFLQPNQYDEGAKPMGRAERHAAVLADNPFARAVRIGYPLLSELGVQLRGDGVGFHDLRDAFATHDEPLYVDTCCHVSARGSALVAHRIGQIVGSAPAGRAGSLASASRNSH